MYLSAHGCRLLACTSRLGMQALRITKGNCQQKMALQFWCSRTGKTGEFQPEHLTCIQFGKLPKATQPHPSVSFITNGTALDKSDDYWGGSRI